MKAGVLLALLSLACGPRSDREPPGPPGTTQLTAAEEGCTGGEAARPATGAPAEGLWRYEDPATLHRVAAMIGPVQGAAGSTRVLRLVQTLESRPGADTIRTESDSASVHLEFIPPFSRPAAVYAVGPRVLLAAYEPCGLAQRHPLIRYLRHDADGRIATDVLLDREARP